MVLTPSEPAYIIHKYEVNFQNIKWRQSHLHVVRPQIQALMLSNTVSSKYTLATFVSSPAVPVV